MRTAILLLTLVCLCLGWYCSSAQRQRRAVIWLQARGCFVGYDDQIEADGGVHHEASSSTPDWLIDALGRDYFKRVVKVRFERPLVVDDAVIDCLNDLPSLRHLEGRHTRLARGMEHRLVELSNLEHLELEEASLNDPQLAALGKLANLRILNLQHNPFRGTGLAAWDRLDNLETLYLSDTAVADENLAHLAKLENLQTLYLGDTGLGDAGLAEVAKIASLRFVSIGDLYFHRKSHYTNRGISRLTALQNLERLDLGAFPLSVQNRNALKTLPHFRTLWVDAEAGRELEKRLTAPGNAALPLTIDLDP